MRLDSSKSPQQQTSNPFVERFEKRVQALTESQEQLRTNKLVQADFKMSWQARGYLMANNLNYAAFDGMVATNIQHCLTRENLELIEFVVDLAQRHGYKPENKELIKQICDQAITAQQLNQRSRIEQAAAVTDLNYISAYFAQFTIDEDPELMAFIVTGKAFGKATYKWGKFL